MKDLITRITQPSGYAGIAASALGAGVIEMVPAFSPQWWLALVTVISGIVAMLRDERKVK